MYYDGVGNVSAKTTEVLDLMYLGKDISGIIVEPNEYTLFETVSSRFGIDNNLKSSIDSNYDTSYRIPEKYKNIDLVEYFSDKIKTEKEAVRVSEELFLFNKYGLEDTLRVLIYIIDELRKNNVLWGVGRGSSVASYCLYLIGVHRIDSLKYDLDIKEFLKDG